MRKQKTWCLALCLSVSAAVASAAEEPVLNIYNWGDYFGKTTLEKFRQETGIKVTYDKYDSNEVLQSKLMTGNSGYDLVFPGAQFYAKQVQANVFYRLDKRQLPNMKHLDPKVLSFLNAIDAGNEHGMPYAQGTTGVTVNIDKVKKAIGGELPDNPLALLFEPKYASKVASCGMTYFDSASEMYGLVFSYMGKDLALATAEDLKKAQALLKPVRPFVRKFVGLPSQYMASGDFCVAMAYSGDSSFSVKKAKAATGGAIQYFTPPHHTPFWIDMMAIPRDAKHPGNALKFMNFIMRPEVIAELTRDIYYSTANTGTQPYVSDEYRKNTGIFPTEAMKQQFVLVRPLSPVLQRQLTERFNQFKTGKFN
ncbi:extracellular solute-binding protein [Leeia oryzae]|uniref:extracellular solute-binding protein n=1 Tax=Leeia oryzae TaxID=356662 RepID=UPI00037E9D63|nr:extracellular solute-binding protein [Leeia oryzae]